MMANNGGTSAGTLQGKPVSRLELLARERAQKRAVGTVPGTEAKVVGQTGDNKRVAMLQRLRDGAGAGAGTGTAGKLSLGERLRIQRETGLEVTGSVRNLPPRRGVTLADRLRRNAVRTPNPTVTKQREPVRSRSPSRNNEEAFVGGTAAHAEVLTQFMQLTQRWSLRQRPHMGELLPASSRRDALFRSISKARHRNKRYATLLRGHHDALFTVNLPQQRAVRDEVSLRFSKPSPDDIVLEQQAKAFDEMSKDLKALQMGAVKEEPAVSLTKEEVSQMALKVVPATNVVVLGHTAAGKTTLLGRLLQDLHAVGIEDVRDAKRQCERRKMEDTNAYLVWLVEQGGDSGSLYHHAVTYRDHSYNFTVAPSRGNDTQRLVSEIPHMDMAILVVDCSTDGFESGFNLTGHTIEHALLAKYSGVKKLIVAMNKLDTVDWYVERYREVEAQLRLFLTEIGYSDDQVCWVPCDSTSGATVAHRSKTCEWYSGPSLLECVVEDIPANETTVNEELLLCVSQVQEGKQLCVEGWVGQGHVARGETLVSVTNDSLFTVARLQVRQSDAVYTSAAIALPGQYVKLQLKVTRGGVSVNEYLTCAKDGVSAVPPARERYLELQLLEVFKCDIRVGMELKLLREFQRVTVRVCEISDRGFIRCEVTDDSGGVTVFRRLENRFYVTCEGRTVGVCRLVR
ncbi:uncharacterized protein KNAG_0L01970 [Huiozyma naganishii CBS 8797]|uniref:Tr-type G domain-containing protein n=1 Tax=Huiozyma naganishii (strain ATCC MYA-139 / BCRC 22969 / CBS 8797 / KCTC 17520 / NBRC 10181 / NCYC 3082 / Yp74L-3) TaxID=1071383 RepID=J7SB77_HUIN7|nr:hypothetical protein KNAG_0L01970 [Kazachstania naganishii CBS 8797]CCK72816.1 hypothetical protein KNAG_0L01970 [Kazachstania naganishii CBS 8797]